MTIREKVAEALDWTGMSKDIIATAAINAFLAAAAKEGWHMRPDEATEEMDVAGLDDPKASYCDNCMQSGHTRNSGFPSVIWDAMLATAPKFEWDK